MSPPVGHATDGTLMSKWSSKPADHKAVRVRNNQRRHRERVKLHIAHLESRLAESQLELEKALSTIEHLTAKLKNARSPSSVNDADRAVCDFTTAESGCVKVRQCAASSSQPLSTLSPQQQAHRLRPCASRADHDLEVGGDNRIISIYLGSRPTGIASSAEEWSDYDTIVDGGEKGYCNLQPPGSMESTTRCRDAYKVIRQQNYIGLDASTLHGWLRPGFRGAIAKEEGCRVDNRVLFALLDYISSSSSSSL